MTDPADRAVYGAEPFSVSPPQELRTLMRDRLAAGETVRLNMVVILVDFRDMPADTAQNPPAHFDSLLFSRGVYPTGSMADYYAECSGGRFLLDGVVKGWYRMPELYAYYSSNEAGIGTYPRNSQKLAEEAVRAADPGINYALYDDDGPDGVPDTFDDDRQIDLLMVIHAGVGGESSGSRSTLRSIAWKTVDPVWVDGVSATNFALTPERGQIGVFAHETGHLLGLPDLYDLTGRSFGLGTWSLMAGGWSLNLARTPVHLDAWCKYRLGFLSPINVSPTLDGAVVDPVETGGSVYRLWSGGAVGLEYFLVENRQKLGFDQFLPGAGLLIYHVDEMAPTNNIPTRYLVGLEQADGRFQLENFYGQPSFGDAGDPYTESTPSGGLGRFTVPDSRSHGGLETGVTVYRITGPDADGRMTASFRARLGPVVQFQSIDAVPVTGNGDKFIEPGESIELRPALVVQGGTAHDVTLDLLAEDPVAGVEQGHITLGDLTAGTHPISGGLRLRVGDSVPLDPYPLKLQLKVSFVEEISRNRPLTVAVGRREGLVADFEDDLFGGFTHDFQRAGYYDLWRPEVSGGRGGGRAWHVGNSTGGFNGQTNCMLDSPLFIIPKEGRILVDHLVEIPPLDTSNVVAGGFVEISVNGSDWMQITPTRGYDKRYFSADPDLNGRYIFTGIPPMGQAPSWETLEFDLSNLSGGAILRFHFFSTQAVFYGLGWWIDNVRVESRETPATLAAFTATRSGEGVRLHWRRAGEDPLSGLILFRSPGGQDLFERLGEGLLPDAPEGEYLDAGALPDESYVYRLDAVRRDGERITLGRIEAPAAGLAAAAPLAAWPNPLRSEATLAFRLNRDAATRLVIFDARGRRVRSLVESVLRAGDYQFRWDGADEAGRPVASGVYLARLIAGGVDQRWKLVVAR